MKGAGLISYMPLVEKFISAKHFLLTWHVYILHVSVSAYLIVRKCWEEVIKASNMKYVEEEQC